MSVGAMLERLGLQEWQDAVTLSQKYPQDPALQTIARDLATLLVNTANCFDPQAVIIGHEGALLGADFYQRIEQEVNRRILARKLKEVRILPSAIPQKIHALNGAAIIFSRLFGGEFKL